MKKTLITLMVLAAASVASAADYTLSVPVGGNNNSKAVYAGDFQFDFCVEAAEIAGLSEAVTLATAHAGRCPSNDQWSNDVFVFTLTKPANVGSNEFTLTAGRGWTSSSGVFTYKDSVTFTLNADVNYTVSNTKTQGKLALKVWDSVNGSAADATQQQCEGWILASDNLAAGTAMTTTFNQTYVVPSPAVPEPATATLSLLALAGLAARRRRK